MLLLKVNSYAPRLGVLGVLLSLLLVTLYSPAQGRMYKWVDDDGTVVFSQTPPPDNRSTQQMKPPPPPAEDPARARQRLHEQLQRLEDNREDRQLAKEKADETSRSAAKKRENCAALRRNLESLQGSTNRLMQDGSGEYKRLTDEERQERLNKLRDDIKAHCE